MNNQPLEEAYFKWLLEEVGAENPKDPTTRYETLMGLLHTKEFVWIVLNDDNRAEDGRALRVDFLTQSIHQAEDVWFDMPCSMLELLIALSRRLSFEGDGEPAAWFWELIENLGLEKYRDSVKFSPDVVGDILDDVIWRTYEPDGQGGLFPLSYPQEDQRDVEIWYQMNTYLLEAD